jgi:phospholipid/cholesterol/gamma-HCH transport system substrate-binding protein
MREDYLETIVGCVVVVIAMSFLLFFFKTYNKHKERDYYELYAYFSNVEGINVYSKVKVGGLEIGEVSGIKIDKNYRIMLTLKIKKSIEIPVDSNLKISTSGIIGSKYLKLEMGGEDDVFQNGGYFQFTESTMDLEEMVTKFILNKASDDNKK